METTHVTKFSNQEYMQAFTNAIYG